MDFRLYKKVIKLLGGSFEAIRRRLLFESHTEQQCSKSCKNRGAAAAAAAAAAGCGEKMNANAIIVT